jgi:hypothetical protein
MTHLLYASNEMFSSTQLIRKSKDIFDKLSSNEIDKAIILRDGKPNFMLLDFNKYEKIMKEYSLLKEQNSNNIQTTTQEINQVEEEFLPILQKEDIQTIEELEISVKANDEEENQIEENTAEEELTEQSSAQIKEFWN